jgi:hypothetical protein
MRKFVVCGGGSNSSSSDKNNNNNNNNREHHRPQVREGKGRRKGILATTPHFVRLIPLFSASELM